VGVRLSQVTPATPPSASVQLASRVVGQPKTHCPISVPIQLALSCTADARQGLSHAEPAANFEVGDRQTYNSRFGKPCSHRRHAERGVDAGTTYLT
jgi:hypothetical protein